ncbi:MAG: 50S ribosomal protein L29 [Elusimicrobia bacterium]|nr:50S ribosomal protein L29 [Elusimicrobiota bacterium]
MKRKNLEDLKNMSSAELSAKLNQFEEQIFRLKFRHATAPVKNPLEIRELRKNIARVKTLLQKNNNNVNTGRKNA